MRKILLVTLLVMLLATVLTAGVSAKSDLARLEIINKTDEKVMLSLSGEGYFFFLTVDPETTRTFTLPRVSFAQKTWACGNSVSGYLDMDTNVRLVFTNCLADAPNKGEPTMEKVSLDTAPGETINWRYFNWE